MTGEFILRHFLTVSVFICLAASVSGQSGGSFTISKSVIAGGGGQNLSGGSFSLGGTIGQPLTGQTGGGGYDLQNGFWTTSPSAGAPFDFDGDHKTDISIFRPSQGEWWYLKSSTGANAALQFGSATDRLAPADFTGDGLSDIAFWRPSSGFWFILRSEDNSFFSVPFGTSGDIPAPGDYDGDGKFDTAIFRPSSSTWFINRSTAGTQIAQFGVNGDRPVPNAFVP